MLKRTGYYLAVAILYPLSWLPYRVLYVLSDLNFLVLYYVARYRRKVVRTNLHYAFPDMEQAERIAVEKRFYRYLSDLIFESIKMISVPMKVLERRCELVNMELFDRLYKERRSCILVLGHYGNWEMIGQVFQRRIPHTFYVLYRKMKNKAFEKGITRLRTKHGARVIEASTVLREWDKATGELHATAFIADQSPPRTHSVKVGFLGKPGLVYNGVGKLAVKYKLPVVFIKIDRTKRGYYNLCAEMVSESQDDLTPEEITQRHTDLLSEQIRRKPELWLWSHRRWKHHIGY